MGLVESERQGRFRIYKVQESKRAFVKSLIEQASQHEPSAMISPLTEGFWLNILQSGLKETLPSKWRIMSNERVGLNGRSVILDLVLHEKGGPNIGVELNVGSPREHLYSMIGKVAGFTSKDLALLILVLLTTHPETDPYWRRIMQRQEPGLTRFAAILKQIPCESETVFREETTREIVRVIERFSQRTRD